MREADPGGATLGRAHPPLFWATKKGLSLFGFMWKIDQFVEVPSIRDKYKESWSTLWRSNTRRLAWLLRKAKQEKPPFFDLLTRAEYLAATHIIFELIELLRNENQVNIADAIWHSVMDVEWWNGTCLDSVANFPKRLTIEKRRGMFQLGLSHEVDRSFAQKWLIDKIMLHGGFWVGRLVRRSTDHEYSDDICNVDAEIGTLSVDDQVASAPQDQKSEDDSRHSTQEHEQQNFEQAGVASPFHGAEIFRTLARWFPSVDRSLDPATPRSYDEQAQSTNFFRGILSAYPKNIAGSYSGYQQVICTLMESVDHGMMTMDELEVAMMIDFADLTMFLRAFQETLIMANDVSGRNSPAYLRQERAIFDLEGDTSGKVLVLTPFQKRLEAIPRPENRGHSVSWVVQPVPRADGSEDKGEPGIFGRRETLKTTGMVRGMWKIMVQSTNRYLLV